MDHLRLSQVVSVVRLAGLRSLLVVSLKNAQEYQKKENTMVIVSDMQALGCFFVIFAERTCAKAKQLMAALPLAEQSCLG